MVSQISDIKVIITQTEVEALLLECNLIKKHKPRYNILLRDDKSYPYIRLNKAHKFPRLSLYRGSSTIKDKLFGPFPNVAAVKDTLEFLHKTFKLRSCQDSNFKHRSRPCLQYQIKRCDAPCVGYQTQEEYLHVLNMAVDFLKGKSDGLLRQLEIDMSNASEACAFEKAAVIRDQVQALRTIQTTQSISNQAGDADVLAISEIQNIYCVVLLMIRHGQVVGSHSFFPKLPTKASTLSFEKVIEAFIGQYYFQGQVALPNTLISNVALSNTILETFEHLSKKKCKLYYDPKGLKGKWLALAFKNSENALADRMSSEATTHKRYQLLQELLKLDKPIKSMECFDISHTQGEYTIGSCVVFNDKGPKLSAYRKFNITGITGGDDYAAMRQVLTRRYARLVKEEKALPDLVFIDGGKGQVNIAKEVMLSLDLLHVKLVGVAKGVSRKPGLETIIVEFDGRSLRIDGDSPALHLIQHIRDEAHRFAITSHRKKREKKKVSSVLEDIDGIGAKRRQALIKRFGGMQHLKQATLEEIKKVPGIHQMLAEKIYTHFHPEK
jgi:excinuclease ABC subunit C